MKERPILFSSSMVRAILEGRKTMTRRVVKPQPDAAWGDLSHGIWEGNDEWTGLPYWDEGGLRTRPDICSSPLPCPYGVLGDRLWVRETFRLPSRYDDATPDELAAQVSRSDVRYLADGDIDMSGKNRPAIFLRYGWHRIVLEVASVSVERVQDIILGDVFKEGAIGPNDCLPAVINAERTVFSLLWDSINAKRGYGWDANPWVWVVEFKRVKP